jgi:ubiquitin-protein ligase E3 D
LSFQEISHASKDKVIVLECSSCKTRLGSCVKGDDNFRFYKSRLCVRLEQDKDPESYPATVFLTAQLLGLIESSVTRKFVVHADSHGECGSENAGLQIWIFNPDIYYSSSKRGPTAYRAMKVFYKSAPDPAEFLETNEALTYEELIVPDEDFADFKTTLQQSTDVLPDTARTFQDWQVGLLDKWEKSATGTATMDKNPLNKKVEEGFEPFKLPPGWQELYV